MLGSLKKAICEGVLVVSALTIGTQAFAIDKAQVLPKGVNYGSVRLGMMDRMGEIFGPSGGISFRGDALSQEFDLPKIKKFADPSMSEKLDKLTKTLDTFGSGGLASQLSLGTLQFQVDPNINYYAPVYARGVTENLTLGIAFPIVNYKVDVGIRQVNSNVQKVKKEMQPLIDQSAELRAGFKDLEQSLVTRFDEMRMKAGYKPVRSRDDTFLGDVQLVAFYQVVKDFRNSLVLRGGVILPTGPEDDPDDLADLDNQHQGAVGAGGIFDRSLGGRWTWGTGLYFLARIPDHSPQRVPKSEDDALPGADRKETLDRDLGDTATATTNIRYQVSDYIEAAVGYEAGTKGPDRFSGSHDWEYQLLSKNSYQTWNKAVVALEYSTVTGFKNGADPIPFSISYDFSDTFSGVNIERQQVHEVGLKMFF